MNIRCRLFLLGVLAFTITALAWIHPIPCYGETVRSAGQTLYVPAYSHVYHGDKGKTFNLTVTLSVRNADTKSSFHLTAVDYYSSKGRLTRSYLEKPVLLGPLESTHFIVGESDVSGGGEPCFIVRWKSDKKISPPVIEAVMIGASSSQGISFVCPARVIEE